MAGPSSQLVQSGQMQLDHVSVFVLASAYLFLKMNANSAVQGYARFRYNSFKFREDEVYFQVADRESRPTPQLMTRADACWRNDLENIPIFLVAALCGLMVKLDLQLYSALVVVFCAARSAHSFFLLWGKQPWRFLTYATAISCTGVMFVASLRNLGW